MTPTLSIHVRDGASRHWTIAERPGSPKPTFGHPCDNAIALSGRRRCSAFHGAEGWAPLQSEALSGLARRKC